ncbi:MAG: helix-turn-helix domain-containing protein [Lachnospiraceae bacterium]|nr:helix-turn-helix domain-containing protein [Lachnospiraceae bacterium]
MSELRIAENIVRFRREKKITQENLADFIGVTKASVSKWETGQSIPDVVILPKLAAFFDVTVDELIGYRPTLSKEQIRKLYQEFADDFAKQPFEEAMYKTEDYVKRYYSCYPFLVQICVLWLNHFMLAESGKRRTEILGAISELCRHVMDGCKDVGICGDAAMFQAMALLQLGRLQEAIEILEELIDPIRMTGQGEALLAQAYLMAGNAEEAESLTQAGMYKAILSLVGNAAQYLAVHGRNAEAGEATITRIKQVIGIYEMENLHPNIVFGFAYQAAMFYAAYGERERTLDWLERCVGCLENLFASCEILMHGDAYFDKMDKWFERLDNGPGAPRNRNVILEDARKILDSPAFAFLDGDPEFDRLRRRLLQIK